MLYLLSLFPGQRINKHCPRVIASNQEIRFFLSKGGIGFLFNRRLIFDICCAINMLLMLFILFFDINKGLTYHLGSPFYSSIII